MSGANFTATISAQDHASAVLAEISANIRKMTEGMKAANAATPPATRAAPWSRMSGIIGGIDTRIGGVVSGIGSLGGRLSSLLPPLAALGGAGAFGGLFKLVAGVAESTFEADRRMRMLGINLPDEDFSRLGLAAKASLTSMDAVYGGMNKLQVAMAKAVTGEDKNVARVFKQLGISLRDSKGQLRSVSAVMDDVFKAFRVNDNPTARAYLARMLFGRSGNELIPMLTQTREEMEAFAAAARHLGYSMPASAKDDLKRFHESWMLLGFAAGQLKKQIGAELAPILEPIVKQMTEWVAANRDWVATGIAGAVKDFVTSAEKIDWKSLATGAREWGQAIGQVVDRLGGVKTIIEFYIGWKLFAGLVRVAAGWWAIAAAASAAGAAQAAAAAAGGAGGAGAGAAGAGGAAAAGAGGSWLGRLLGARVLGVLGGLAAAGWVMTPSATQSPQADATGARPRGPVFTGTPEEARRINEESDRRSDALHNPPRRHPLAPTGLLRLSKQKLEVEITLNGFPPGADVTTRTDGDVLPPTITFDNLGRAFGPMPGSP